MSTQLRNHGYMQMIGPDMFKTPVVVKQFIIPHINFPFKTTICEDETSYYHPAIYSIITCVQFNAHTDLFSQTFYFNACTCTVKMHNMYFNEMICIPVYLVTDNVA